jgi:crossover junction endodeoxyribonuclease RuvC
MKILAIDPGYDRCGVAILEKKQGSKEVVRCSACIQTDVKKNFEERLNEIHARCKHLLEEYSPTVVVLERLYFNTNQKTAIRVAEVRGMLIQLAHEYGARVYEYTPPQVKLAVAGSGRASKKDVGRMVQLLVSLPSSPEPRLDDEFDAIALGLTHIALARHHTVSGN